MSCADALSAHATEIDHIFPASRSFDDSQANKVLCFVRENRDKENRTPFEWMSGQEDRWQHLTGTVWPDMVTSAHWPDSKRRRCMKAQLERADDESFTHRQLTDTSFIARAARGYLGLLFGGGQAGVNAVQVVPGRATAQLRGVLGPRAWPAAAWRRGRRAKGARRSPSSRRGALTVALIGPGAVQQLSRWWQVRETVHTRPSFAAPWPDFRDAARAAVEAIVVSHRVQAKLSGPLHEETRLGDTGEMRGGARLFVKRKPVAGLTLGDVKAIRDPAVRGTIEVAIAAVGGDLKKVLAAEIRLPRKDGSPGPVIRRVRLLMPLRGGAVMSLHPIKNIHAEFGKDTNDHIAIYCDGEAVRFLVTRRREAMLRAWRGEPVVLGHHPEGGRLVMALHPGDVLHRQTGDQDEYRLVRKFYGAGPIFFKPLTMAVEPETQDSRTPPTWVREGWRKVAIDPIGRVRPAK